jgi:hypothetical protein
MFSSRRIIFTFQVVCLIFLTLQARADIIPIGLVSFDQLIPGDVGVPGINAFTIANFTGTNSLPPDFPVATDLSFLTTSLQLTGDFSGTIDTGDIPLGAASPASLDFPDTILFTSATFSGTLNITTFVLSDGRTFVASQPHFSASLLPSSPPDLAAGIDFAVINIDATESIQAVPEPSSCILVCFALLVILASQKAGCCVLDP